MKCTRRISWLLAGAMLAILAWPASSQVPPQLTAARAIHELESARDGLSKRLHASSSGSLESADQGLKAMLDALRAKPAGDLHQALVALSAGERGLVLRAHAAAQRAQDYLKASSGCLGAEDAAMAAVLASSVQQLADTSGGSSANNPAVIDAIESTSQHPLFVIRHGGKLHAITVIGVNLTDPQCAYPRVTVTNAQGVPLDQQPTIEAALPTRIQLNWPGAAELAPGSYVLHVVPKKKHFLFGCSAQPQALSTLQVMATPQFAVDYTLNAVCRSSDKANATARDVVLGSGVLGPISIDQTTAAKTIDMSACADPVRYTLAAKVSYGDGSSSSVGPITQAADANITVGLRGGLSLTWDPSLQQLFARLGANRCLGVH
ncbi:hypothetical protein [Metallibacterium sp.]|uniref:hypothetical protein n=1 Tax=Metallibacterium sp. TaxID=2940281 RepID=UPI0026107E18|nr:hypothetical protein [Metallibacterium sp.]